MDARVATVLALLETRPGVLSPVSDLARRVNLSASRLRHLFRAQMSVPLGGYVREQRLRLAEQLLRSTFMSVKEIAAATGFADEAHFVHSFRRSYAVPPGRFRRVTTTDNR